MAPFKSTQSFTVGHFLKTLRNRDAAGPAALNSPVRTDNDFSGTLNVPAVVASPGRHNLKSSNLVISTTGTFDITAVSGVSPFVVRVHVWGAGGGNGAPVGGPGGGGAGGFSKGEYTIGPGTTYKYVVGASDGNPSSAGQPSDGNTANGGGYSGVFTTSVSQANAIIMAGGGGGGGYNDAGNQGSGGGGGGATAQDGYSPDPVAGPASGSGGTQSAGGTGGSGSPPGPYPGGDGSALQGGAGGTRGGSRSGGGGGGSGYYGGGGGAGQTSINSGGGGGGGGSGYLHPSTISNGTTTTASGRTRVTTSPVLPAIPAIASKGNTSDNELSMPNSTQGGPGCIVIELVT